MASPFVSRFLDQFKLAAAEGAVLELKLRMLCEAVRGLGNFAHALKLENVEDAVVDHFGADLREGEAALLKRCRQLRNKILHGNFRTAREKLREAGVVPGIGGVRMLEVDESGDLAQQVKSALGAGDAGMRPVAETGSTSEGKIFGWLLELGIAGDFLLAAKTFREAVEVLDRLAGVNAERNVATDRRADT